MRKNVIAIMTATVILLSFLGPTFFQTALATDPEGWYTTVNGVLDSDYYLLYPYASKSLNVGFSKYGELIGIPAGADQNVQANWVGLEYDGRDPFCPATEISMTDWINGWYIDIQYICPVLSGPKRARHLWAFAMFADGFAWGGDWIWARVPGDSPHGGRKTNGSCTTEDMQILYDGPRRFVAMSVTHIYDKEGDATWPVLDVKITLIFNKVKKEITLLKDIKLTIDKMKLHDYMDVQFSDREEYDLGPALGYTSYAHFYEQYGNTSYGPDWHMADQLIRHNVTHLTGDGSTKTFTVPAGGYGLVEGFMMIWIDGVYKDHTEYDVDWGAETVTFDVAPGYGDDIEFRYKYIFKDATYWAAHHKYDIAQVIASDANYVAWTAMWPCLSDWTVDGISRFLDPLVMVREDDMSVEPKRSPLIISEWDFNLEPEELPMFRCVEVKGVTDLHDADDLGMSGKVTGFGYGNVIDREAWYQLDEIFLPWDLRSAVHKGTKRWVAWKPDGVTSWTLTNTPVVVVADAEWDQYSMFAERVIRLDTYTLLHRRADDPVAGGLKDYNIVLNADGTATLTGLPLAECKILYSTREEVAAIYTGLIQLGLCLDGSGSISSTDWSIIKSGVANAIRNNLPHDSSVELTVVQFSDTARVEIQPTLIDSDATAESLATTVEGLTQMAGMTAIADGLYITWNATKNSTLFNPRFLQIINVATDGAPNVAFSYTPPTGWGTPPGTATGDVTWVRDNAALEGLDEIDAEAIGPGPDLNWMRDGLVYPQPGTIAPPYIPGWVEHVADATEFAAAMAKKFEMLIPWPRGRYEWGIVGRDAASVDSAGLSLVSAAFKNKDIEYGIAGEDMYDPEIANQMPWVMHKFGTGDTWQDYYYNKEGFYVEDYRTALKDDWCTYWPITSSNMIGVGGPLANLLAYYGNDFTDAFYGLPAYAAESPYSGKITGIPCWNRGWNGTWNVYESGTGVGYAVISTYKDINGTVLFLVWGHWGRDTYYATQWLHGDVARGIPPGIWQLQDAPPCLTSIILKIDYTYPEHPTFSIVESLGTISETLWIHNDEVKGGIHDCP